MGAGPRQVSRCGWYSASVTPLRPHPCPLDVCDCHIGYVHLESLPLYDVFAGGVPERIPRGFS